MSLLEMLNVPAHSHGQSQDWLDSPFVGWWRGAEGWVQPSPEIEEEAKQFIGALVKTLYNPEADGETIGELIDRLTYRINFSQPGLPVVSFTTLPVSRSSITSVIPPASWPGCGSTTLSEITTNPSNS